MKQFTKGHDPRRNVKGRPKGTPNKSTDELRGLFQSFLEANMETVQSDFDKLEPKDRLQFIERVARLVLPPPMAEIDKMSDQQFIEFINKIREQRCEVIKN